MSNNLNRLFVGSLPYNLTEGQLLELFVPFGRVISVSISKDFRKRSRGLGFVEYDNPDSALEAKNKMHNHQVLDRTIIVDYAKPDPFLTPEGQQRHQQAKEKNASKENLTLTSIPRHNTKFGGKSAKVVQSRSDFQHIRQSVFDSRFHHSRVGSKFAAKSRFQKRK